MIFAYFALMILAPIAALGGLFTEHKLAGFIWLLISIVVWFPIWSVPIKI